MSSPFGRVAVAVERQLGLSPSVIQDAVDAHRGLRESIAGIRSRLNEVDAQLGTLSTRPRLGAMLCAVRSTRRCARAEASGTAVWCTTAATVIVAQRTSSGQFAADMSGGSGRADQADLAELKSKLTTLQQAFDFLDSHHEQLRILIDAFGPGGLPVSTKAVSWRGSLTSARRTPRRGRR